MPQHAFKHAHRVLQVMRLRQGALLWGGVPCSSFVDFKGHIEEDKGDTRVSTIALQLACLTGSTLSV